MRTCNFDKPVKVVDVTFTNEHDRPEVKSLRVDDFVNIKTINKEGDETVLEGVITKLDSKALNLKGNDMSFPVVVEYDMIVGIEI
jgi:hypothetical protein